MYATASPLRRQTAPLCVAILLLLQGCAEINHLRDAQDTFSRTAALENQLRFGLASPDGFDPSAGAAVATSVTAGYASVVHSLSNLGEPELSKLKEEHLHGVVLTLLAMSHWRLGQYDAAKAAADQASGLDDVNFGPRDRALLAAIPGLVRSDQAFGKIYMPRDGNTTWDDDRIRSIVALLNTAEVKLAEARTSAPPDHPVQLYLVQAQLAADKNLNDACDLYAKSGTGFDTGKDAMCKGRGSDWGSKPRYDCRTFAHMASLESLLGPDQQAAAQTWRRFVGNPPDEPPAGCP